jgi:hypothetical protein
VTLCCISLLLRYLRPVSGVDGANCCI